MWTPTVVYTDILGMSILSHAIPQKKAEQTKQVKPVPPVPKLWIAPLALED